jgi:peptidoglycan/LPS O-acetylase OafA/YrhL
MSKARPTGEVPGIEVLRFLSALAVLIWHYQHFFFDGVYDDAVAKDIRPQLPFYTVLLPVYEHGFWAVNLFWAISGFVFFWRYSKSIEQGHVSLSNFAVRRFSRLYPLHIATLILVVVLQYLYLKNHENSFIYPEKGFTYHLFLASNWFNWQSNSFNGPIWSVSTEILIYFMFYGVIRAFGSSIKIVCASAVALFVAFNLPDWHLYHIHVPLLSSSTFLCGVFFFAGGLAEKAARYRSSLLPAVCIGLGILLAYGFGPNKPSQLPTLILAVSATIIFAQIKSSGILRLLASLGNATYSSYLLHFPIQLVLALVVDALGYSRSIFLNPLVLCGYLAVTVATALAVYHWFELPAQNGIRNLSASLLSRRAEARSHEAL